MPPKYSSEFKEQALQKTLNRGGRTIGEIAIELSINFHTLKSWLRDYPLKPMPNTSSAKRPGDWTSEERLQALMASYGLKGDELNAFCRQQGLFTHHLDSWKNDFCMSPPSATQSKPDKALRDEVQRLNREISRKDKALAEAAALLVLQKKFQAFWAEKDG